MYMQTVLDEIRVGTERHQMIRRRIWLGIFIFAGFVVGYFTGWVIWT